MLKNSGTMITTHVICCSHLQGQRAQPPKTLNASSKSPKRLSGSVGFFTNTGTDEKTLL